MLKYHYDGLKELLPEDDAAIANWGIGWQMPNYAQMEELTNSSYTTTEWTTRNGVNGMLVTSKSNGNSIFLPAVGIRRDTSLDGAGSYGWYWSRSILGENDLDCGSLLFGPTGVRTTVCGRLYGLCVRPVRKQSSGGGGGGSW